jgi:hypothetical protein
MNDRVINVRRRERFTKLRENKSCILEVGKCCE